jgi:phenylalanyl-tRNA synthetase beta chain
LRYERSNSLLGTAVPADVQKKNLALLGFEPVAENEASCTFRVPTWRHDVSQEADLIEEVARLFNYDNIAVTLPSVRQNEMVFAPHDAQIRKLRRHLVGAGLTEIFQWTFSCADDVRKCELDDAYLDMVTLENPLSEKQAAMRSSLLPGLMANVAYNVRHGSRNVTVFEIGPVYRPKPGADLPVESLRVGIALTGAPGAKHWSRAEEKLDFYDLKGCAETLLDFFGQKSASFEEAESAMFQNGQCGAIKLGEKAIGTIGAVKPSVLKAFDADQPVYLADIDLQALLELVPPVAQFEELPQFPASLRDMAVMVDANVPAGALRDAAVRAGGKILKTVEIFDIYTGKQVPEGKKSVALNLVFQSMERTLTDKDTQKAWDGILRNLQRNLGAELR